MINTPRKTPDGSGIFPSVDGFTTRNFPDRFRHGEPNPRFAHKPIDDKNSLTKTITTTSNYQEGEIVITKADIKRCITKPYRDNTDNQRWNEDRYQQEIKGRINAPKQVYKKNYKDKPSVIYEGTSSVKLDEPVVVTIVNQKNGKVTIDTRITAEEYEKLKDPNNNEFELTDLRRNSDTQVMDNKSVLEASAIEKAIEQGFTEYTDAQPYKGERLVDMIDKNGKEIEIKSIGVPGGKSTDSSIFDVTKNLLKNDLEFQKENREHPKYLIDLSAVPEFRQFLAREKILNDLKPIIDNIEIDFAY